MLKSWWMTLAILYQRILCLYLRKKKNPYVSGLFFSLSQTVMDCCAFHGEHFNNWACCSPHFELQAFFLQLGEDFTVTERSSLKYQRSFDPISLPLYKRNIFFKFFFYFLCLLFFNLIQYKLRWCSCFIFSYMEDSDRSVVGQQRTNLLFYT